jgi:hypothetical protein
MSRSRTRTRLAAALGAVAVLAPAGVATATPVLPVTPVTGTTILIGPHARLSATPAALPGAPVVFSAAGSTGGLGPISKYEWDLDGDGTYEQTTLSTTVLTRTYATTGTITAHLRVTGFKSRTSTASATVVIHRAPTAAFTAAPRPARAGSPVTLDASDSSDDDGAVAYAWDLDGNGSFETPSSGPILRHAFPAPGTAEVGLRVTDRYGATDTIVHAVPVVADTTPPRVAIRTSSARIGASRALRLTVACPASELRCRGRIRLVPATRAARAARFPAASFSLAGGQARTLRVTVGRPTARLVGRLGRVRTLATVTARDAAGNTGVSRRAITVRGM